MRPLPLRLLFLGVLLVSLGSSPAGAAEDPDLAALFRNRGLEGTLILSNRDGSVTYLHQEARTDRGFLPASSFKILHTLIALKEGAIRDKHQTLPWDGKDHGWSEWNRDQSLSTAFPSSCVWFYQELAKRIGDRTYQRHLEALPYGNGKTGPDVTTFWLDGDLRITPREQLAFLRRLQKGDLPYPQEHQELVRQLMVVESTPDHILRAKTGWALRVLPQIGWYVGYLEKGDQVWFFVHNLDIRRKGDEKQREALVREALRVKGIL